MNTATDGSTGALPAAPVGVVLAGGASRRMGRDKALLALPRDLGEVWEESLPAAAARRLAAVCAAVVVADRGRRLLPGLPSLPDGAGRGPAAGILGAAAAYPGRRLLVLACDLPRVPDGLLADLAGPVAGDGNGVDWAVPRWAGRVEPLCALYGPAALAALAARVERGLFALHELAGEPSLAVRYLEGDALARFGPPEELFLNLNTPEDWKRYGEIWRRKS
jgi:molybdopterin-guanine dinucleotide biosynthesis protein A